MNIGFLGCGHIASALAEGWSRSALPAGLRPCLFGYDINPSATQRLQSAVGLTPVVSSDALVDRSDVLVIAVRPSDVRDALVPLGERIGSRPVMSLAAGIPVSTLLTWLPQGALVGRAVPNVAVARGAGLIVWTGGSLGRRATGLRQLFAQVGAVVDAPERLFDEATAVAACGPGFVALFIEAFEQAGEAAGLNRQMAAELAFGAVAGTVELVRHSGDAEAVRHAVSTPGGMTAAGIEQLEKAGLRPALKAAIQAAVGRSRAMMAADARPLRAQDS